MILTLLVAVWALVGQRIRITRSFQLTGTRARMYGLVLILLMIPITLLFVLFLQPLLPPSVLGNPVSRSLANSAMLASILLGLAWLMRDRDETVPAKPSS